MLDPSMEGLGQPGGAVPGWMQRNEAARVWRGAKRMTEEG